jgi:hypothetical protein
MNGLRMRFMMKKTLAILVILTPFSVFASLHETLPTWHWSYTLIDRLQGEGLLLSLDPMNRPYTRGEVGTAVDKLRNQIEKGIIQTGSAEKEWLDLLSREFDSEISEMAVQHPVSEIRAGGRGQGDFNGLNSETKYRGVYRSRISASLGKHAVVSNAILFNQYLVDDPNYNGKKWRGIVGFTEQAYFAYHSDRFAFKFGRDFLRWGAGRSGSLLLDDPIRPLDQLLVSFRIGPFRYSYITSALDDWPADSTGISAKRYISAHRLDASFLGGRLRCAVTEAVIYGGPNRQPEWVYLNPFIFYHGENLNQNGSCNTLGMLDLFYHPIPIWELYGSLLIDDIQIEKTGPGDLEPNEIGFILGSRFVEQKTSLQFSGEYVRVNNRTFKTPIPWETWSHRGDPLGYPLGNDFDSWILGVDRWIGSTFNFAVEHRIDRKGEGGLFSSWDQPWMSRTVEEGYSEPFPTGVVEKRSQTSFRIQCFPSTHWGAEAKLEFRHLSNTGHILGMKSDETAWRIGFWWSGDFRIIAE